MGERGRDYQGEGQYAATITPNIIPEGWKKSPPVKDGRGWEKREQVCSEGKEKTKRKGVAWEEDAIPVSPYTEREERRRSPPAAALGKGKGGV